MFTNTIEKETSSMMEIYYAVNGLNILSEKLSRDKIDNIIKTIQNILRKDDNLWKYDYSANILVL